MKKGNKVSLIKQKNKEVTQELIVEKTSELCELLKKFEGSKSCAVHHICAEAIIWGTDNYYEALGILTDVMLTYRDISNEILEEDQKA